jgi:hypothetical protein
MVTKPLQSPITQHCKQHHANLRLAEIDSQYCLQNKLGLNKKIKQYIINKYNQKENKSQIHHEYKVEDQVLLEVVRHNGMHKHSVPMYRVYIF